MNGVVVRYASGAEVNALFVSEDATSVRMLYPASPGDESHSSNLIHLILTLGCRTSVNLAVL